MTEVTIFQPKSSYDVKANLVDFIEYARRLNPLGIDQTFESNSWSARGVVKVNDLAANPMLHFCTTPAADAKTKSFQKPRSDIAEMHEPFLSFSKAIISYSYAISPTTSVLTKLTVLRFLQIALKKITGSYCPTEITTDVLNCTCQFLLKHFASPYSRSIQLQNIYALMTDLGLVALPMVWKSFIPCPKNNLRRSGVEFDKVRNKRLPNPIALDALAFIFNNPKDRLDIVITSICAILLCAPDRISEALSTPEDCIVRDKPIPGSDKPGLSLRWFPAKGGAPMLKRVVASMAEVAIRAVERLQKLGEPARVVARWYELNPTNIYLPQHLEYLRFKEFLSRADVNLILSDGKFHPKTVQGWIALNLPNHRSTRTNQAKINDPYLPFIEVEKAVIALLPTGFPILNSLTGLRYSEALCICRFLELTENPHYICLVQKITVSMVTARFGANTQVNSIFKKYGLTDETGGTLRIKSHMFRHYLSTVAKAGGLSDIEGDKWAGRKTASHSRTYDHHSDRDVLAEIQNVISKGKPVVGPLINMDKRMLITREEFASVRVISAHTTNLGYCLHDFASLPCQIHGDHMNCNEHLYIKGDKEMEMNLRCLQSETCTLLGKARRALTEEEYGADSWVKHQTLALEKIDQVLKILDDPEVPAGALIQPSGINPPSRIMQAMEKRLSLLGATMFGTTIKSIDDVHRILATQVKKIKGENDG